MTRNASRATSVLNSLLLNTVTMQRHAAKFHGQEKTVKADALHVNVIFCPHGQIFNATTGYFPSGSPYRVTWWL